MDCVAPRFFLDPETTQMKRKNQLPPGWDEARVRDVIDCYENQAAEEATAEHEAELSRRAFPSIPEDSLWFHHPEMQERVREGEADITDGRFVRTRTPAEAQAFLDSLKRISGPAG